MNYCTSCIVDRPTKISWVGSFSLRFVNRWWVSGHRIGLRLTDGGSECGRLIRNERPWRGPKHSRRFDQTVGDLVDTELWLLFRRPAGLGSPVIFRRHTNSYIIFCCISLISSRFVETFFLDLQVLQHRDLLKFQHPVMQYKKSFVITEFANVVEEAFCVSFSNSRPVDSMVIAVCWAKMNANVTEKETRWKKAKRGLIEGRQLYWLRLVIYHDWGGGGGQQRGEGGCSGETRKSKLRVWIV